MKRLLMILVFGLLSNHSESATIYIPSDYPTIQSGINAAAIGDSVIIKAGTYIEHNIQMKYGIHLCSETGNPEDVTIDASQNGSVILCEGFVGHEPTTIEALTITSSPDTNIFFGIWCEDCSNVTIRNNIIRGNGNSGIVAYNSNVTVEENRIFDNGHVSIGFYGDSSQTVTIRDNVIYNNRNMYAGEGLGGGIYCSGIRLELSGNLIYNNRTGLGGGVFAISCKFIHASNNTIANNRADNSGGGIVLVLGQNDSAVVETSILWADSVDEISVIADSGAYYDFRYCNISGGWEGHGNFDLEPEFCDTALGDFSLKNSSPCLPENNDSGLLIGAISDVCGTLGIDEDDNVLPHSFKLAQNYPNPFNPATSIEFDLPRRSEVKIVVYNLLGQAVSRLVDQDLPAGKHSIVWDGRTNSGAQASTGLYFYRLEAEGFIETKKMLLLK